MSKLTAKMPAAVRGRKQQKHKKGSSTTGKSKGLVPDPGARVMAKRARSYKQAGLYGAWCHKMDAKNNRKSEA